jgi:uncharacterized protein (DUF427 family)
MDDRQIQILPCEKWVRVLFDGRWLADSQRTLLLMESGRYPVYCFPQENVRMEMLVATGETAHCPTKGLLSFWTVQAGDRKAEKAAWRFEEPTPAAADLQNLIAFDWDAMDAWFEEDEKLFSHVRSPFHRVEAISSSRHVRIVVGGETIAETRRPVLVFETGVPARYYLPKVDVRLDRLVPSETHSQCPYKGEASYYSLKVGDELRPDSVWTYPFPLPEVARIQNLVCFYNDQVDEVIVDGRLVGGTKG